MAEKHIFLIGYSTFIDEDHPLADDSNIDYIYCLAMANSETDVRKVFWNTDCYVEEVCDLGPVFYLTQDAADAIKECIV